jgi:hypothetical protein
MSVIRRPVVIAVWAAAVVLAGSLAAARHDDTHVQTEAKSTTTTSTSPIGSGVTVPGAGDVTVPGGGTSGTVPGGGGAGTLPGDAGGESGGGGGGGATAATRTMPLPGSYRMASTGSASLNGKAQTVPPETTFVIEQVSDTDQRFTSSNQSGAFVVLLRYAPTEVDVVSLQFAGKTFEPSPPGQFAPVGVPPGTTWAWSATSSDGKTTLGVQGRYVGTETVTVADQAVDTDVVDLVFTISGDFTGTIQLTTWARSTDKLPVRQHTVVDAGDPTRLLVHVQSDVTSQLVDLIPN